MDEFMIDPELLDTGLAVNLRITYDKRLKTVLRQLEQLAQKQGQTLTKRPLHEFALSPDCSKLLRQRAMEWKLAPSDLVDYLILYYLDRLGSEILKIDQRPATD